MKWVKNINNLGYPGKFDIGDSSPIIPRKRCTCRKSFFLEYCDNRCNWGTFIDAKNNKLGSFDIVKGRNR